MIPRFVLRHALVLVLAAASAAPFAWAQFQVVYAPPFRGAACTEYSGFESFTQAFGGTNAPDDPATTSPDTTLEQLVAGAILTGAGNIDHLSQPPSYRLRDSVPADLQEVVLQVSIHLNQFPWANVLLSYTDGGGVPHSIAPTSSTHLVFLMGHEERLIRWDLSGVGDTILAYTIDFAAAQPSTTLDAIQLDTRYACATGVVFCAGDGSGVACPCANGLAGRGCENSFATGGGVLSAVGTPSVASDTLVLTASALPPTTTMLFFQGNAAIGGGAGAVFGDGVRCATASVVRLGLKMTSGGSASYGHGVGSDPDISVRGTVPSGALRYYQGWYRNSAAYCTASTFNLTNGLSIQW